MGAVHDRVPGGHASAGRGVKVEVGEKPTAIDLHVVVEYGVSIREVAAEVRENVIAAVERMTGLEVGEVNIAVNDGHLPDEDTPQTARTACSSREAGRGKDSAPSLLRDIGTALDCKR